MGLHGTCASVPFFLTLASTRFHPDSDAGGRPVVSDDDEDRPRRRRSDPDDSEEERPRRRRRDEDEEVEERPRRGRRADPDEEEEEERPRRKSRKKEQEETPKKGFPVLLLLLGGGFALLAVFGVCIGVVVIGLNAKPGGGGDGDGLLGGGGTSWRGKRVQPAAAHVDLGSGTKPNGPEVTFSREPLRVLVYRRGGFGPVQTATASLFDVRNNKALGSADVPPEPFGTAPSNWSLSPDGDRFGLYEEGRDVQKGWRTLVKIRSVPDGKMIGTKWQLDELTQPKRSGEEGRLAFMRLISRDKLVTVSKSGIVESWDVGTRAPTRLADVAKPGACALSADRGTLAVWSGAGFSIIDVNQANAQPRRTEDVAGAEQCVAACFSPDGKRLAGTVSVGGKTSVVCFDVASGKKLGEASERHSHLAWWGNRYVIPNEGYGNAYLFDSDAGKIVTKLLVYSAFLLPESPDGRLYLTAANVQGQDVDKGLTVFDPPVADVAAAAAQGQLIFRSDGVYGN
jgi:hypothetical protein